MRTLRPPLATLAGALAAIGFVTGCAGWQACSAVRPPVARPVALQAAG